MRYLKSFESNSTSVEEVKSDVLNILSDIEDYKVSVAQTPGGNLVVSISKVITYDDSPMNLDSISDTIIRLYEYMKNHQTTFKKNPDWSHATVGNRDPGSNARHKSHSTMHIGYAQLDKRHPDAYKSLCDSYDIYSIGITWAIK